MTKPDPDRLEELLAEALAAYDQGGEPALVGFVAAHPEERSALERGLQRCRQMGLLGPAAPVRDFPERLGEFRLLRRLGSGGMGVVYEAEQASLGRRVALKVVRPELLYFEGARERFRREIEAVARLSHPAVVPVLASGEQDGLPWYAMELLSGHTAHEVCRALQGRDPATLDGTDLRAAVGATDAAGTDPFAGPWWQVCVRIAHAVALGVRHAHLRGIVHRDIKPSNVMLTAEGRTVLLDFGVARVGGGREFTRTGNNPGSPAFMSPEQLRGDAVDERTDVYSLGATLWQLLALDAPFPAAGAAQRARDAEPPDVATKNRQVPRELALVVRTAMDPDRERRYADVEAFAEDLQAVLQRRPIRARRLGPGLRTFRWCQRHRVAATVLGCALFATLSLPALFAWRERETNAALSASAAAAASSAQAAEASLQTTLDAIYGLIVRVSDHKLRYVPAAAAVAADALQDACAMYRQLLPKHPHHERLRLDASKALTRFGELQLRRGEIDKAEASFREAIAGLGGDSNDVPPVLLDSRAVAWLNLASALRLHGDAAGATAAVDAAARDNAAVGAVPALGTWRLRTDAQIELERAYGLDPFTDAAEQEEHLRKAIALVRELRQQEPDDHDHTARLVSALDTLATMLSKNKRYDDAEPLLEEALSTARVLPEDSRIWPPQPALLAEVLETYGNLLVDRRDQRCVAMLKECLALREKLARDFPHDLEFRTDVAAALHNLANMNFWQEQDDLALERLDRALALQRSVLAEMPRSTSAREYLRNHLTLRGSTLAKLGRRDDLVATATELQSLATDRAALRSAARLWLRAYALPGDPAPRDGWKRRALELLLQAEKLGWGPRGNLDESVYAPLRDDPEFQALQQRHAPPTQAPR